MTMNPQFQGTPTDHVRQTFAWWLFLARVGAVSVEVFLHRRFGSRYCRLTALMVVPLGLAYTWLWAANGYDVRPLLWFYGAYVVALLVTQMGVIVRLWRGDQEHSYYNGYPLLLRQSHAAREGRVKLWAEPMMVGSIGVLVTDFNDPLGIYLMFAGFSLFVCGLARWMWQRRQVVDMQDAVFEQQNTAGSFRQSFGY
jgi:hypothetical protein